MPRPAAQGHLARFSVEKIALPEGKGRGSAHGRAGGRAWACAPTARRRDLDRSQWASPLLAQAAGKDAGELPGRSAVEGVATHARGQSQLFPASGDRLQRQRRRRRPAQRSFVQHIGQDAEVALVSQIFAELIQQIDPGSQRAVG